MSGHKYVALDVDSANIVAGVYDSRGKKIMSCNIKINKRDIQEFFRGLRGTIHVVLEEGTQAAWLYDVIRPLVAEAIVCDPRSNKLLQSGNKGDKIDTDKLARLLRLGELKPVYHGEKSILELKHLVHGYENLVSDATRTKNRLKAIFRGRAIRCRGASVYDKDMRDAWLKKLDIQGMGSRAKYLLEELDCISTLRKRAEKAMKVEARKHKAYKLIKKVPGLGDIRVAMIIATVGSPHRFRTKRQFWPYCGLSVVTRSSADYEWVGDRSRRRKKRAQTRGLNKNYNRRMKSVFKGAAATAIIKDEQFNEYYNRLLVKGIRPEMALLTVSRKLAAITLTIWKKGETFDPQRLNQTVPGTDNE